MCGQGLGHEADLRVGLDVVVEICVEDPIQDGPIVDRITLRIFRVGVGTAPFRGGRAIARCQEVVSTKVRLGRSQLAHFREQFLAI